MPAVYATRLGSLGDLPFLARHAFDVALHAEGALGKRDAIARPVKGNRLGIERY